MKILLISTEAWGPNYVSKHHYARFLAEGHEVIFLDPATGFSKVPFGAMSIRSTTITPRLSVITYRNLLPKLNGLPVVLRNWIYRLQARRILKQLGGSVDLVWSFDPRRYTDQKIWKAKRTIYHSVDLHPGSDEKRICETSDLVVGLSEIICADLRKFRPDAILVGHGSHIDPETGSEPAIVLPGSQPLKAIYTGNFHRHIDYSLLIRLAEENPDVDFILAGPTAPSNLSPVTLDAIDLGRLKAMDNVHLVGSIPGDRLFGYVRAADICLVLFKKEFELIHHAPHKLMAYFAAGKVVLSNYIDAHKRSPERLIKMVPQEDIASTFLEIRQNLAWWNSDEFARFRKAYAEEHHYRKKIEEILSHAGL